MTVLSYQSIMAQCSGLNPIIAGFSPDQVKSASYDLRVGSEYFLSSAKRRSIGAIRTQKFSGRQKSLEIPANQVALIRTREDLRLPDDLVGHLSLKLDVLLEGLIMASQSQVDAGYSGPIYVLLYNLSGRGVVLHTGQSLVRLEFEMIDAPTDKPYKGDYKPNFTLADAMKTRITSSLQSIEDKARDARRVAWGTVAGATVAVVTMIIALLGPLQQDASDAKAQAEQLSTVVKELRETIGAGERHLRLLEARLESLGREASDE